ncbi:MAG TPA: LUD domain-containing protein [Streptosporangiaceae bacterium]
MSARDDVLSRIRTAIGERSAEPEAAFSYRERGELAPAALLDLLADRLVDYRAHVRRATVATLPAEVGSALAARGARRVIVPSAIAVAFPDDVTVVVDEAGLSAADLDRFDGVITRAAVAIAETGTIILDSSQGQGRRAISLVPDYHLCIVAASQVVHLVPEAVARLAGHQTPPSAGRPLTWISGPSATSDIELERVEGVHGPRTLEVILVADA